MAKTEAYVDSLLEPAAAPRRGTRKLLLKDVRLFLNSVDRHLETLKQAGIPAELRRQESEDAIVLTITLPKRQKGPENTCESASRVV